MEEVLAGTEVPGLHDGLVAGVLQGLGDPLRPGHVRTGVGDEEVPLPGHASASLRLPRLPALADRLVLPRPATRRPADRPPPRRVHHYRLTRTSLLRKRQGPLRPAQPHYRTGLRPGQDRPGRR